MNGISRREALRLGAGALLSLGLWPGAIEAAPSSGTFRFLVVNDTHYMSPECGQWLANVVRQMKQRGGAEFCLLAGDLTEHGRREDLKAVRSLFKALDIPVYVQIGNHDYLTQEDRSAYEKLFPRRINYFFRHRGWQFIGLDTTDGLRYEKTRIQEQTFRWVQKNRRIWSRKKPTVLFTHFPLAEGVRYRPQNADALLEQFLDFNLRAVFCGHFHGLTEQTLASATLTTNRCCALKRANHDGTPGKGYFLCTARDGQVFREFIEAPAAAITQP